MGWGWRVRVVWGGVSVGVGFDTQLAVEDVDEVVEVGDREGDEERAAHAELERPGRLARRDAAPFLVEVVPKRELRDGVGRTEPDG